MHRENFDTTEPSVYFEAAERLIRNGIYAFELYTDKEQLMLKVDSLMVLVEFLTAS